MRFAADYSGWIYIDADSALEAATIAMNVLSAKHPYDEFGGDWELMLVEPVDENEGR